MRDYFESLTAHLDTLVTGAEVYLATFAGEDSDFVRLNRSAVRQAGQVKQRMLGIELIDGARHAHMSVGLTGRSELDRRVLGAALSRLRECLRCVADDPHFLFNEQVSSTEHLDEHQLPPAAAMLDGLLSGTNGLDLVGFLAAGRLYRGFANSLGQRNWHATLSANFDWSLHLGGDRAVKAAYGGKHWDEGDIATAMAGARAQLRLLERPAISLEPGTYRAYLAPRALAEVMELLSWGGFGMKQLRTRQSPLIRLGDERETLAEAVHLEEHSAGGIAPAFQNAGFIKPDIVPLVESGRLLEPLISPRSAREFDVATNGASDAEVPQSLSMRGGCVDPDNVLAALGTGLYVNNLWYLNYSDRAACRMTGMTRFAAFWVDNGEIVAPVNVMRFDDSIYRLLGRNLEALTSRPEMILSTDTYESRSVHSMRLPGALVGEFRLTL